MDESGRIPLKNYHSAAVQIRTAPRSTPTINTKIKSGYPEIVTNRLYSLLAALEKLRASENQGMGPGGDNPAITKENIDRLLYTPSALLVVT